MSAGLPQFEAVAVGTVQPEPIRWCWQPFMAFGKTTLLEGNPGGLKTTIAMLVAAYVSRTASVLILATEDSIGDTLRPRLEAAEATLQRIHFVRSTGQQEQYFELPRDVPELERLVRQHQVSLVIIDPLMAFLGQKINSYKDQDVRRVFTPLARLAESTGAAILIVRHLNKAVDLPSLYRGGGSIGIAAAARSVLVATEDPRDKNVRILVLSKSNLVPAGHAIRYRAVQAPNGAPRIEFLGPVEQMAVDDLLAVADVSVGEEAERLLMGLLKNGPVSSKAVMDALKNAGISIPTGRRAQKRLSIKAGWHPKLGGWAWWLPGVEEPVVLTF